jgi:hypothetical protein
LKHASISPAGGKNHGSNTSYVLPGISSRYEYSLVLDLDETLVHFEQSERKFKIRPNCITFLKSLS